MRVIVAAFALAPFVLVLIGMATGRVRVQPCCQPTTSDEHRGVDGSRQAKPMGSELTSTSTCASGSTQ
jgi:hypothetical protein